MSALLAEEDWAVPLQLNCRKVSQRGFRESIRKPRLHEEACLERKKERKD